MSRKSQIFHSDESFPGLAPPFVQSSAATQLPEKTRIHDNAPNPKRAVVADAKDVPAQMVKREDARGALGRFGIPDLQIFHVYVGNLNSRITEELLRSLFEVKFEVKRVVIRCGMGQAVVGGPYRVPAKYDRQYATVEFFDPKTAKRALRLNGTILNGCHLMVTMSVADLPEANYILKMHQEGNA